MRTEEEVCDLRLSEHVGEDRPPCNNPEHRRPDYLRAVARRALGKVGGWGKLERGRDAGGVRDFVDGEPIHAGSGLVLQNIKEESDDYGEFSIFLQEGTRVRYESGGKSPTLYTMIGGHEFATAAAPWMRFRVPVRR
jgi:hypothetical protein